MILNCFTARFARDAEIAEVLIFSFAVERTAKENHSTAYLHQDKKRRLITKVRRT